MCVGVGGGDEADGGAVCSVGVVVVGRGTTCVRGRLVGAKTPCRTLLHHLAVMKRVKFAYVGGMRG